MCILFNDHTWCWKTKYHNTISNYVHEIKYRFIYYLYGFKTTTTTTTTTVNKQRKCRFLFKNPKRQNNITIIRNTNSLSTLKRSLILIFYGSRPYVRGNIKWTGKMFNKALFCMQTYVGYWNKHAMYALKKVFDEDQNNIIK